MAKKEGKIVIKLVNSALEIIRNENGNEITRTDLVKKIKARFPDANPNTITGSIHKVGKDDNVKRPGRALFRWETAAPSKAEPDAHAPAQGKARRSSISEQDFYTPCADYLIDSGECTKAVEIGGNYLREWRGTPDVMGVLDAPEILYKYNLRREIVSVEVKAESDTKTLWEGFGQACAYAAFSNRSYLAVPKKGEKSVLQRLVFLCRRFGIGLILFDLNVGKPNFTTEVVAQSQTPDFSFLEDVVEKFRDGKAPDKIKSAKEKLGI